jgi:DNA polymerase V
MAFPSPAADYIEQNLDLNALCIAHPSATFFMQMGSDDLQGLGIHSGDLLVVDRSLAPATGDVVVIEYGGERLCRELLSTDAGSVCVASHSSSGHKVVELDGSQVEVFGVVAVAVKRFRVRS